MSPQSHSPSHNALDSLDKMLFAYQFSTKLCPIQLSRSRPILDEMSQLLRQVMKGETDGDLQETYSHMSLQIRQIMSLIHTPIAS